MTLLIMAAGLGSRYGAGCKQLEGVGPGGEMLMEYAAFDAARAGFSCIVFVIKDDMRPAMERLCEGSVSRLKTPAGEPIRIFYAVQDFSSLPDTYTPPSERLKPFGTVHAVLCAKKLIDEPFAVINADDFYGASAFKAMAGALSALKSTGEACMIGYRLENTLSENGGVNRGVCREENGFLTEVRETYGIKTEADGKIRGGDGEGNTLEVAPDSLVSMTFWGYTPWIFGEMEHCFDDFLRTLAPDDIKSEYILSHMMDRLLHSGKLSVKLLQTDEKWFGMTYSTDRPAAAAALKNLHDAGVYPPRL